MIDLERRVGPWSLRAWGLVANFVGNALALYGAAGAVHAGTRWPILLIGLLITAACLLILAVPTPDPETTAGDLEA